MLNWLKGVVCRLFGSVPVSAESAEGEHTGLDWCNVDTSVETLPASYTLQGVTMFGDKLQCGTYVWTLPEWRRPYIRQGLETLRQFGQVSIPNDLMVMQCDLSDTNVERVTIREMLCQMQGVIVDGCSVSLNR